MRYSFIFLMLVFPIVLLSQSEYKGPSLVNPNYLPAYNEDLPIWAKMLYQKDINFPEVQKIYDLWKATHSTDEFKSAERYYKIWRKQVQPYLDREGFFKKEYLQKSSEEWYQNQKKASIENKSSRQWHFWGPEETFFLNPGQDGVIPDDCPWQVNVYSFAVFNQNEDILYCGTETGFVNKSADGGENWELVTRNYPVFGGVTAVAIDPFDPDIVYFAGGSQIHKTTNGGQNWQPLLPPNGQFRADKIIIHPDDSQVILAAGANGIFKTVDAGLNWQQVWNRRSYDVEFIPGNPNRIYGISDVNGQFSICLSQNGGDDFTPDPAFPENIPNAAGGLIAATAGPNDQVFAVLLSENNTPFIYKKEGDPGVWERLAIGNTSQLPMNNGQGFFDLVLEVDPDHPEEIFVGTVTLYKSSDGGASFQPIGGYAGDFPIHPDIQWMELLGDGKAWVATDGGMTYSTDNFTNVGLADAKNKGLIGSDMWGFDQAWNEDLIVGGRYHNGNTAIADYYQPKALRMGGAESPTGWIMKGKQRHVAFNDLGPGFVLPEDAESAAEDRFLFTKYPNMDEYGGRRGNLFAHPNYYEILYLGEGNGFWRSEDLGESFELLHDFGARIRYCQVAYSNPDVMYADIVGRGLYKTEDGGLNWRLLSSLTEGPHASPFWAGRMHFVISPTDPNVIYVCLKNGTWSADIGKVLRSVDGGESWEDWSAGLSEFTKVLAIQPDQNGVDMVYLFTNSKNGSPARCYVRKAGDPEWSGFDDGYPAGMNTIYAAPFFRDGKLRVAGNAGIWESPLSEPEFAPIINAWVNHPRINCGLDTVQLEDHSLLNHQGAEWSWTIEPEPLYLEGDKLRNPKVVFGDTGIYSITLIITQNGETYRKHFENMVQVLECPSVDNCERPALLTKSNWELMYVSSEETIYPGLATMAFDDDLSTIWHTRWTSGSDRHPHEIQIDLKEEFKMSEFIYYPRQAGVNGRIRDFELYISNNPNDWGEADSIGQFEGSNAPTILSFNDAVTGRYLKLVALSEINDNIWTSIAELGVRGCLARVTGHIEHSFRTLQAFPVPTDGEVEIPTPGAGNYQFSVYDMYGHIKEASSIQPVESMLSLDFSTYSAGTYVVILKADEGRIFKVKVVKQ
ncbi:MAG TPA: discoidin domain-containing protein [Saprospiraceae bacterium]|nr:discoidin domain-containing protein [Saprospiraceae bacterium]